MNPFEDGDDTGDPGEFRSAPGYSGELNHEEAQARAVLLEAEQMILMEVRLYAIVFLA